MWELDAYDMFIRMSGEGLTIELPPERNVPRSRAVAAFERLHGRAQDGHFFRTVLAGLTLPEGYEKAREYVETLPQQPELEVALAMLQVRCVRYGLPMLHRPAVRPGLRVMLEAADRDAFVRGVTPSRLLETYRALIADRDEALADVGALREAMGGLESGAEGRRHSAG